MPLKLPRAAPPTPIRMQPSTKISRRRRLMSLPMAEAATSLSRMARRSEEHTSELQSRPHLVCRLLLEKKKKHESQKRQTQQPHPMHATDARSSANACPPV